MSQRSEDTYTTQTSLDAFDNADSGSLGGVGVFTTLRHDNHVE